ncbi:MAG TPA: protein tyrosine phosphatase family protein [Sphingomonas sp.]|nr:protein tyrosine phosphatase family protein [Sphingomonas sp.]
MADPAILNWRRLDANLTTSGQPSEEQLAQIAALGIRDIINLALHTHPKALADEAASAAALGMRYVHIPVEFDAPGEADYARFRSAMAEAGDRPVHVHCIVNARVSAFLYRHRRDSIGEDAARAEMESVWKPGGVWAGFIGDKEAADRDHLYAGRDY